MKNQIKWSFAVVTLGFVGLGLFTQNCNNTNGDHSYVSTDSLQELRKEEIRIEALKKANLTRI